MLTLPYYARAKWRCSCSGCRHHAHANCHECRGAQRTNSMRECLHPDNLSESWIAPACCERWESEDSRFEAMAALHEGGFDVYRRRCLAEEWADLPEHRQRQAEREAREDTVEEWREARAFGFGKNSAR